METRYLIGFGALIFFAIAFSGLFVLIPQFTAASNDIVLGQPQCVRESVTEMKFIISLHNFGSSTVSSVKVSSADAGINFGDVAGTPILPGEQKLLIFSGLKNPFPSGQYGITLKTDKTSARAIFTCQ